MLITDTSERAEELGGSKSVLNSANSQEEDESDEDIFTKSLAPYNLNLKNFLDLKGTEFNVSRAKKISDISEIFAFNLLQQKVNPI